MQSRGVMPVDSSGHRCWKFSNRAIGETNEARTFNGDGAQRSNQIYRPHGFHPEQADLFAHNEIFVYASCKKVFTNLADAQEGGHAPLTSARSNRLPCTSDITSG